MHLSGPLRHGYGSPDRRFRGVAARAALLWVLMKRSRVLAADATLFRFLPVLALWIGLYAYAGRPILIAAAARGLAPALAWGAVLAFSLVSLLPFFLGRRASSRLGSGISWLGYATMSLFSILFVLVAVGDLAGLAARAIAWAAAAASLPMGFTLPSGPILSRAILILAGSLAVLGLVQARRPRVREIDVAIDGLPADLEGFRIVQLSDIHIGPTIQKGFVRSLVDRVNRLEADAVVITGDLVDGHVDDLREEIAPLGDLRSAEGTFWVTGNHEYYWRAGEWIAELDRLGLRFLQNENRLVRRGQGLLAIAGVTDPAGRDRHSPDLQRALAGIPRSAVTVLLSHRPQTAEAAANEGAALQLSGHTHGGQFFPFSLLIRWFQPVVAGLHRIGGMWLYVSRGTGYWGPPSRLGVGSEVTLIRLRRA